MSTSPVVARVLRLANEVHGLARDAGRADLRAPLAGHAAHWTDAAATVVLAGAQKRGKSRLLNALVERPGLLPVDADIATHTQVTLRRGAVLRVTVRRASPTTGEGAEEAEIDPAELAAYASVSGDPEVLRTVSSVDVTLDAPFLDGLCLVDTPGVDSLTLGHRHTTIEALARSDAVLFAVSAQDQPVLRHELEFLAEVAERIHVVAFVLTKVEDSTSWRDLLDENRRRVVDFCGDSGLDPAAAARLIDAPWFPVSAKLADAALSLAAAGHRDRAASRLDRSGVPALRRYLRGCAERRELVRAGSVLAVAVAALRSLAEADADRSAGRPGNVHGLEVRGAAVDAQLEMLAALRRERRRRSIDHQLLGRGVTIRARARLEGYRRTYEREIAQLVTPAAVARYADELPDSLDRTFAAAWQQIAADVEGTVRAALARYLVEMGADPADLGTAVLRPPARSDARLDVVAQALPFDLVSDGLPAVMLAGSAGFMAYNALGFAALAVPLVAPLAVGGLLAATVVRHRRRVAAAARDRAALGKALADVFASVTDELCLAAEQATGTWRAAVEDAVDVAIAARQQELDARRRQLAARQAQDAARREREAAEAAERLAALSDRAARAEELRVELAAALRGSF
jgi:Dynamin family